MSSTLVRGSRRTLNSESGSIIILTALSMVVLLGIVAFAVDASFLYTERNRMAAAADAAAKAAAIEWHRSTFSNLQKFAEHEVVLHGFNPQSQGGQTKVEVFHPPSGGIFIGNSNFVEVLVSQPTSTFFAQVINAVFGTVTPMARAVAGTTIPPNCLVTDDGAGGGDLVIGGSAPSMSGCDVAVGRNLTLGAAFGGSPPPTVSAVGTCSGSCVNVKTGQLAPADPVEGLAAQLRATGVTVGANCPGPGIPAVTNPLAPGCYTTIPTAVTQLLPGTFQISGPITTDNLSGNDVLIYLTGTAALNGGVGGNLNLNLTGLNSGPYAGIAVLADPGVTFAATDVTLNVTGAFHLPSTDAVFNSLNANTTCAIMTFRSLTVTNGGGASMSTSNCQTLFSTAAYLGVSLAE